MSEPFQGRYRLAESRAECGHLPRHRITGVTLTEPAEAIALPGARRWGGLPETVRLRAARRREQAAVACPLLAVEQDGDTLLVIHPELPPVGWAERVAGLPPRPLAVAMAPLIGWLADGLRTGVGCGNLRLSTVFSGPGGPLVSPAAWAFPLPLLAQGGQPGRLWRALGARGESGEARLDIALLCHDLARLLTPRQREDGAAPDADEFPLRLRDGLSGCAAAARLGADASALACALADLLAMCDVASAPGQDRIAISSPEPCPGLHATAAALAERSGSACLVLEGVPEEDLIAAVAAVLPAAADLTVARGLTAQRPLTAATGARRHRGEAWLVIADAGGQPPTAARRWLEHGMGERPCKVIWLGAAGDTPAMQLLRRDLASRWGLVTLVDPVAGVEGGRGADAVAAVDAPPTLSVRQRLLLGIVAAAGLDLPLVLLGRAASLQPGELGEALAPLCAAGLLTWRAVQAAWTRDEWNCAVCATDAGRAAVAADLADDERRRSYLGLVLHQLPPGRRPELHWLRFHLAAVAGDAAAAIRELTALLSAPAVLEGDEVVFAACAAAWSPPLAGRLPVALRVQAALRLGRTWEDRGLLEEARGAYEQGLALAGSGPAAGAEVGEVSAAESEALAELCIAYADLLDKRGEFAALHDLLQHVADAHGGRLRPALLARLQFEIAWARYRLGRHDEALEGCHALLRRIDVEKQPAEAADIHNLVGLIRYESSRYEEARIDIQKGLVLRERAGERAAVARSCNNLGLVHLALGDLARAEACLQRSLAIKNDAGDLPGTASCLLNMAYIALHQERHDLARERGEQALGIGRAHALRQLNAEILLLLGEVAEAEGRLAEAAADYAEARALAQEIGDADQCLAVLRHQAGLALRQGDSDAAWAGFREAQALVPRVPSQLQRALLRHLEGDLLTIAGDHAQAAVAFAECAEDLVALHKPELQVRAQARAALAFARSGQPGRARELFGDLRRRTTDLRLAALPAEFHELEKLLGQARTEASARSAGAGLLLCLLGLPAIEAQRPGFAAYARRVAEMLHGAGTFSGVAFTQVAATGEELGRWEAGETAPVGGRVLVVRDVWADGTEIVGAATFDGATAASGQPPPPSPEEAQAALALATGALAGYRARVEEGGRRRPSPASRAAASRAAAAPSGVALIGTSEALADLRRFVEKVADLDAHVLILGENGSGKELVAQLIHARSARSHESFVAVNCASIPANLLESTLFGHERGAFTDAVARRIGEFELAGLGTILLDEIGEMPLPLQSKLLRVLQEKEFRRVGGSETLRMRARVLAATNLDIERAVAEGHFRQDLYYRLAVLPVRVPPLRERPEDVPHLLRHFLEIYAVEFGVPVCEVEPEALAALMVAPWRGNVRELQNLARRMLIFAEGRPIRRSDLPAALLAADGEVAGGGESLEEVVARLVRVRETGVAEPLLPRLQGLLARHMLARSGSKAEAARRLGITTPTLYDWLRRDGRQAPGGAAREQKAEG